jgi:hypothetical protein
MRKIILMTLAVSVGAVIGLYLETRGSKSRMVCVSSTSLLPITYTGKSEDLTLEGVAIHQKELREAMGFIVTTSVVSENSVRIRFSDGGLEYITCTKE